ncbi:hypothetical protein LCGC14_0583370 [marine sediment metagenome]|uniref:Phage capsid-like C-terminal domain-containing protein n=1 Tax=marine sediment metagenome TaxID=412755 RepID=A0A0F9RZH5_9ZZZZ
MPLTLAELTAQRVPIWDEMQEIGKQDTAESPLTTEQTAEYGKLSEEFERLTTELDAAKAGDARRTQHQALQKQMATIPERQTQADKLMPDAPGRHGGKDTYSQWLGEDKGDKPFRCPPNYKPYLNWDNFGSCLQQQIRDPQGFHQQHMLAVEGMSEGIGGDGGFMVLPEFSQNIFDRVWGNDLISRTNQFPVQGNTLSFPRNNESSRADGSRAGGIRGYWLDEGATATKSAPTLGRLTLTLKKAAVLVYLTQELIDDGGSALEQWVSQKAAEEFEFLLGDAIVNGTGAGRPQGFLQSDALVTVTKEAGQVAATIVSENLDNMWARLAARSQANSVWMYNQNAWPQLAALARDTGTAGQLVFSPPTGIAGAPFATIYGRPLVATEFNAGLGTVGDITLTDLSQYVTITKGAIRQDVSMHVQFLTDQMALRFIFRIDGQTWENSPVTPFKGTGSTQSSFIAVETRA